MGNRQALSSHVVAIAEQEEQSQQCEAKQHDAMNGAASDRAAEFAVGRSIKALGKLLCPAGMGEVRVPPIRDGPCDTRR